MWPDGEMWIYFATWSQGLSLQIQFVSADLHGANGSWAVEDKFLGGLEATYLVDRTAERDSGAAIAQGPDEGLVSIGTVI